MEESRRIPFPQADDVSKIFKIINVTETSDLKNVKNMQIILGDITSRQVQYYLTAAQFLGILNLKKEFTKIGLKIRSSNNYEQKIHVAKLIVSNEVFADVYFSEVILGVKLNREEISTIMRKYNLFNSEQMYHRRAQTVLKWIEWINNNDERIK